MRARTHSPYHNTKALHGKAVKKVETAKRKKLQEMQSKGLSPKKVHLHYKDMTEKQIKEREAWLAKHKGAKKQTVQASMVGMRWVLMRRQRERHWIKQVSQLTDIPHPALSSSSHVGLILICLCRKSRVPVAVVELTGQSCVGTEIMVKRRLVTAYLIHISGTSRERPRGGTNL